METEIHDPEVCEKELNRITRAARSDGLRNRAALIEAAKIAFARDGMDAPLEPIAADAGVGIGTLYRHFPTRIDLLQEVLAEPLRAHLELVEESLINPDVWEGFAGYVRASCAFEADSCGYLNIMTTHYDGAERLQNIRNTIQSRISTLFDRAREAKAIRDDITVEDMIFIMLANSRIIEMTRDIAPNAWKRNVELFLDSVRPERAHPLGEPPMRPRQVYLAMIGPSRRQSKRRKN